MHGGEAIDAMQRQPVAAIADLARLRIRASVDEADYPHIVKGQSAKISADASASIGYFAESANGTARINKQGRLEKKIDAPAPATADRWANWNSKSRWEIQTGFYIHTHNLTHGLLAEMNLRD
jgi:hypothetical protein